MKKTRFFLLGDVTTGLGAIVFAYYSMLGKNYLALGNKFASNVIWMLIIALMLCVFAIAARNLKRTHRDFGYSLVGEIVLLLLFTGLTAYYACTDFSHYFVIRGEREEIRKELIGSIERAERMFSEYELYAENRKELYKRKLESIVDANRRGINTNKYIECGFKNDEDDEAQANKKMFAINVDLFPSNYPEMKQGYLDWLSNARNIIEHWKSLGTVNIVNEVEQKSNALRNELKERSTVRQRCEQANNFDPELTTISGVREKFGERRHGLDGLSPFSGIAILLYGLMLMPYLFAWRSTKL